MTLTTCHLFVDPYHTYLGLACLNILSKDSVDPAFPKELDARWNATAATRKWMEEHLHIGA